MATTIRDWIITAVLILLVLFGGYEYYKFNIKPVPQQQVTTISAEEISKALIKMGHRPTEKEVTTIVREIEKVKEQPPQATTQTMTVQQGSLWAQELAKKTNADKMVWETPKPYTNNFYSISLDKQKKLSAGITVISSKAYLSASYQDRDNQLILHGRQDDFGVTYLRTIKRW